MSYIWIQLLQKTEDDEKNGMLFVMTVNQDKQKES